MPNPKRRHSKARRGKRRAHDALTAPQTTLCPNCQEPRLQHRVCPKCGQYKGRQVVQVDGRDELRKTCKIRAGQVVSLRGARVRLLAAAG